MYLSEILFQHELCSLELVVDNIWYPSLYDFTKDKLSFVQCVCVHTVICMYTVCKCVCTVDVYIHVYTVLTTGPCMLLELFQVYCRVCLYRLCVFCVYRACVCTHSPQVPARCWRFYRCTVQCVCTVCECPVCTLSVQFLCVCIHSPQVPVHCWRFYRCTVQCACTFCVCSVCTEYVCVYTYHRSLHTAGDFTGVQTFFVGKHCWGVVAGRTESLGEDTLGVVEAGSVYHNLHTHKKR